MNPGQKQTKKDLYRYKLKVFIQLVSHVDNYDAAFCRKNRRYQNYLEIYQHSMTLFDLGGEETFSKFKSSFETFKNLSKVA